MELSTLHRDYAFVLILPVVRVVVVVVVLVLVLLLPVFLLLSFGRKGET